MGESVRAFSRRLAFARLGERIEVTVAGLRSDSGRNWVARFAQVDADGRRDEVVLTAEQFAAVTRALISEGVSVL